MLVIYENFGKIKIPSTTKKTKMRDENTNKYELVFKLLNADTSYRSPWPQPRALWVLQCDLSLRETVSAPLQSLEQGL